MTNWQANSESESPTVMHWVVYDNKLTSTARAMLGGLRVLRVVTAPTGRFDARCNHGTTANVSTRTNLKTASGRPVRASFMDSIA